MADHQVQRFPLTSTGVQGVTVSGNSVAILYYRAISDDMQVEMSIWTPGRQIPVQCRVKSHGSSSGETSRHDRKIMIGTKKDCLIMFERCVELRRFYFTRFGLDGQLQAQGSLEGFDDTDFSRRSESSVPSDINGCAPLWSYTKFHTKDGSTSKELELVQIQYDPQGDELRLKKTFFTNVWWLKLCSDLFFWKDVAYCRSALVDPPEIMIMDLTENNIESAVTMRTSSDPLLAKSLQPNFFGDEDFLINIATSGFVIWCFNGNIKMATDDKHYAEHRQKKIQGRLEERRELEAQRIARVSTEEKMHLSIIGSVGSYHKLQGAKLSASEAQWALEDCKNVIFYKLQSDYRDLL